MKLSEKCRARTMARGVLYRLVRRRGDLPPPGPCGAFFFVFLYWERRPASRGRRLRGGQPSARTITRSPSANVTRSAFGGFTRTPYEAFASAENAALR